MRMLFAIMSLSLPLLAVAQLRYPIQGVYNKRSAQGMAIYEDNAFLMSDGGYCRLLNLVTGEVTKSFSLASASENPHVNNACFGIEKFKGSEYPVIYISECRKEEFRCFVESFDSVAHLRQTIQAQINNKVSGVLIWAIDMDNRYLYSITRIKKTGITYNTITKYRLPNINEGKSVVLSEKDILDRFDVIFPNILQGCKVRGKYMYIVTGLQQSLCNREDAKRAIQVINLKEKKLAKTIDLTYVTTNEPEDIDFYKGKCLLYCGQEGGIYEVKLK